MPGRPDWSGAGASGASPTAAGRKKSVKGLWLASLRWAVTFLARRSGAPKKRHTAWPQSALAYPSPCHNLRAWHLALNNLLRYPALQARPHLTQRQRP